MTRIQSISSSVVLPDYRSDARIVRSQPSAAISCGDSGDGDETSRFPRKLRVPSPSPPIEIEKDIFQLAQKLEGATSHAN